MYCTPYTLPGKYGIVAPLHSSTVLLVIDMIVITKFLLIARYRTNVSAKHRVRDAVLVDTSQRHRINYPQQSLTAGSNAVFFYPSQKPQG